VDPLKPFTSAILSLWPQANRRTQKSALAPTQPVQTLQARLRSRMPALAQWNATQARQMFVECVLVAELGEHLASDPAFGTLVQHVSQQLQNDAKLSARLDALLKRVAAEEAVT
jgi:hypothetical protein